MVTMTKEQARKLGVKIGRSDAAAIWSEAPQLRLAEVAEKYRHKKSWEKMEIDFDRIPADSVWDKKEKRWSADVMIQIPNELRDVFRKAYVAAGATCMDNEVRHAIKTGLLEEV